MQMMKELSVNIFDPDLNIAEIERFQLHEKYLETVDKSIDLQNRVTELIVMEMSGLEDYISGRHLEDSDDEGGVL